MFMENGSQQEVIISHVTCTRLSNRDAVGYSLVQFDIIQYDCKRRLKDTTAVAFSYRHIAGIAKFSCPPLDEARKKGERQHGIALVSSTMSDPTPRVVHNPWRIVYPHIPVLKLPNRVYGLLSHRLRGPARARDTTAGIDH